MKKARKILIKLVFVVILVYAVFTIINQQEALNQYERNKQDLLAQIQEENEYKEELTAKKENINSLEFIEQTAREYLDMYLPNEKVYVDEGR